MSQPAAHDNPSRDLRELEHRLAGLNRLLDVTRRVAAGVDLDAILQTITYEACQALDCDRATLYQFDAQRQELYTRVVTELEIAEIRGPITRGISGYVARTGEVVHVPEPARDPRWNSAVDRETGYLTRNILAAPVRSQHDEQLLGVIELFNKRHDGFQAFDTELLGAFCQHAAVALDRARLVEELHKRQRVEASLKIARDVQRSFMPRVLPQAPHYELATWWFPHEAVGGDYCDVIPLGDGKLALVIADVSGHGLGPSLLMASVRAALRALVLAHREPDELVERLAAALAADLCEGRFITIVLAVLDPRTHQVRYANAGHGPALVFRRATRAIVPLESTGFPLGVMPEASYGVGEPIELEPGDLLLLCTDGIVDAVNARDEPFGRPRLDALLEKLADRPAAEIVVAIGTAVEAHYVGESPPDDLTILLARRSE